MISTNPRLVTWFVGLVGLLVMVGQAPASDFCVNSAVTLQNALLRAAANGQDDKIYLVQGAYFGNFEYSSTEAKALMVLGGYTEDCASRAIDPTNTILDGRQTGRVLALSAPEEVAEFTIEGLTLQNGKASSASVRNGGGLYANAGTKSLVTVKHNCQIINNSGSDGGGAYVRAGTASLSFNSIHDNESSGGHFGGGGAIVFGRANLTNNSIQGNTSTRCGGGILLFSSNAILTGNLIQDNASLLGGGVCFYNHYSTT
ncbi:MAG: hypothetical protein WAT23_10125 [Chromatiaceae bacterium]